METSPIEEQLTFKGFEDVNAGIVKWHMSVIRLQSGRRCRIYRQLYRGRTGGRLLEGAGILHSNLIACDRKG